MNAPDITRVAAKVRAFRQDYGPEKAAILTSFVEDEVSGVPRVVGCCRVVLVESGALIAEAHGTRALRPPKPGAQGHQDTRDPDRAMTQATGRAMGLLGYADGESIEGDTDEPDESGVQHSTGPPLVSPVADHGEPDEPSEPSELLVSPEQMAEIRSLTARLLPGQKAHLVDGFTVCDVVLLDEAKRPVATAEQARSVIDTLTAVLPDDENPPPGDDGEPS